jgi:glutathione synthase/RimK-type ligase-like ATP-grasp enzyme
MPLVKILKDAASVKNLIVVSNQKEQMLLSGISELATVLTAEAYLKNCFEEAGAVRVFNLCNDYAYCKKGYYVSLLAEARKHRPLPTVSGIADLQSRESVKLLSGTLNDALKHALKDIRGDDFQLSVYFGRNMAQRHISVSRQIFNVFQAPLLRVFCARKGDDWHVKAVRPITFREVPESHLTFLIESMRSFFGSNDSPKRRRQSQGRYDLAILCNPKESMPPSDSGAIRQFLKAARELHVHAEVIEPKDLALLNRFDGLFIRETTNVVDHTFRFAKRAELSGLVVMDDPTSILKCCNKIYLHDMLLKKGLSTPKTWIIYKNTDLSTFTTFPLIIKKPDSAFSAGVKKVDSPEELRAQAEEYFKMSDLLVLQEFLQTDFDWRIGVINNEPLYSCRYYMAKKHWQIINRQGSRTSQGRAETFAMSETPAKAVQLALKACREIGTGLYGVDIKEKDGKFYVIEVNDNPSIDKGVEDKILGLELYRKIISVFLKRMESR